MPASAPEPSGEIAARRRTSASRSRSRAKHLDVGEQVVRERDRLRALQVRVAGQDGLLVLARAGDERALEPAERRVAAIAGGDDEEPLVERDLVVAAAAGVQVAGVGADELAEPPLDVGVHVLERRVEADLARRELGADLVEGGHDPARHRLRHDPLRGEHGDVGLAAADVLRVERAVVLDRDGERDEARVGLARERGAGDGFRLRLEAHRGRRR